jgi:hypothetical protein
MSQVFPEAHRCSTYLVRPENSPSLPHSRRQSRDRAIQYVAPARRDGISRTRSRLSMWLDAKAERFARWIGRAQTAANASREVAWKLSPLPACLRRKTEGAGS